MDKREYKCFRSVNEMTHSCILYRFIKECKQGGKKISVWTVNEPDHMAEVNGHLCTAITHDLNFFCGLVCEMGRRCYSH